MRRLSEKLPFSNSSKTKIHMNSYKHLNNETTVDILMFSLLLLLSFFWFIDIKVLCFIFIVEKDKETFLKLYMMYFPYFEISAISF